MPKRRAIGGRPVHNAHVKVAAVDCAHCCSRRCSVPLVYTGVCVAHSRWTGLIRISFVATKDRPISLTGTHLRFLSLLRFGTSAARRFLGMYLILLLIALSPLAALVSFVVLFRSTHVSLCWGGLIVCIGDSPSPPYRATYALPRHPRPCMFKRVLGRVAYPFFRPSCFV